MRPIPFCFFLFQVAVALHWTYWCFLPALMGSACLQVKNKLCLAVLGPDEALGGRVGLGAGIGRYQANDASQGLFLILQAMPESKGAGVGLRWFARLFVK